MYTGADRRGKKRASFGEQISRFSFLILGTVSLINGLLNNSLPLFIVGVSLFACDYVLINRYQYFWILDKIRKSRKTLVLSALLMLCAFWAFNTQANIFYRIVFNSATTIIIFWFIIRTLLPFGKQP